MTAAMPFNCISERELFLVLAILHSLYLSLSRVHCAPEQSYMSHFHRLVRTLAVNMILLSPHPSPHASPSSQPSCVQIAVTLWRFFLQTASYDRPHLVRWIYLHSSNPPSTPFAVSPTPRIRTQLQNWLKAKQKRKAEMPVVDLHLCNVAP